MRTTNTNRTSFSESPYLSSPASQRYLPIVWGIFLLIPILYYIVTIYKNAYNFPLEDDFNSALSFLSEFAFAKLSWFDKLKLLFSQYNEHRIFFDRLVFITDYYLFGELNFRHAILVGNVSVLLLAWLFFDVAFPLIPRPNRLFYLLPVAYSLFLFKYWDLSTWAMAALQNLYVMVFAMFSLSRLVKPNRTSFFLACGAAVLAVFTSGNGLFCFLAGIPVLLLLKSYRRLMVWCGLGIVVIALYFWGYKRPPYHPDVVDSLFNHTGRAVQYFFSLIGAMIPNHPSLSIGFGIASFLFSLGLVGYLWYVGRINEHLPIVGLLIFLYLTCASLMASRSGFGVEQAFSARYGIVVVMLYATQAVLTIATVTHQTLRIGVTLVYTAFAGFLFISGTNAVGRRNLEQRYAHLQTLAAQYYVNPDGVTLPYGDGKVAKVIFEDAIQKGIYRVPKSE